MSSLNSPSTVLTWGFHNREAIRHYVIEKDRVRRVDPVALSPRDFVDEWLVCQWTESSNWSSPRALQSWHQKLHADFLSGEFGYPTMHCQTPDLWQVAFRPDQDKKDDRNSDAYFLVRWRPPYHFTMMSISDKAWPLCKEEDPKADEWRTLFPVQNWR